MPMYAITTMDERVNQIWYVDDAAGAGKLDEQSNGWDQICSLGPSYGYFANAAKTWLITKEAPHKKAMDTFDSTKVQITTEGRTYLGAEIGTAAFPHQYIIKKVEEWSSKIETLASFALTQPHAALTHGLSRKWLYVSRTVPDVHDRLTTT